MILKIENPRPNPYAQIDRALLEDKRLSYKAKGLLCYLLSRPPDWQVVVADLANRSRDGKTAVYSALDELREFGYASFSQIREKGRITNGVWVVRETPIESGVLSRNGFSSSGSPKNGEATATNKKEYKEERKIKNSRSSSATRGKAARASDEIDGDLGFFKNGNTSLQKFEMECSHKLGDYLRQSRKYNHHSKPKEWLKQFGLLLNAIEGDSIEQKRERVKRVLNIYTTEQHTKFTPQAECAKSFRIKFTQIERWANEAQPVNVPMVKKSDRPWKRGDYRTAMIEDNEEYADMVLPRESKPNGIERKQAKARF